MAELRSELIYETGNADIDLQHRYLVDLIKRIQGDLKHDTPTEEAMPLFDELMKYSHFHFASEENIMRKNGYDELATHINQHQAFIEHFEDKLKAFQKGDEDVDTIFEFLIDWFALHTSHDDKKFAGFLNNQ